jgi:flagellar protein FliS
MKNAQYANSYRSMAIATATPGQLILMLFDGALRFQGMALNGFHEQQIVRRNEQIHNNIVKSQNILRELQVSLDMKVPGDFSQRMYALYDFMIEQLQLANVRKDPEPIHVVERLLGIIRDAWAEMLDRSATRAA